MSMVAKIWHAVKKRAAETDRNDRVPIVLALDEFQRIGDMNLIGTLLAQARGYGMGLILAHQNASQIEKKTLEGIMGNCSTMIFGRLSGSDASKIATMVDPAYSEKLRDSLAGLASWPITPSHTVIFVQRLLSISQYLQVFARIPARLQCRWVLYHIFPWILQ